MAATACETAGSRPKAGSGPTRTVKKTQEDVVWYVYILKCGKINRYYTGHTENLERRLKEHNNGKTQSLRAYLPVRIIYTEEFSTKQEAFRRERQIKSYKGGEAFKRLLKKN